MKAKIRNIYIFFWKLRYQIRLKHPNAYPFIDWLTFANAGMIHKGNIYSIEYAIEHLKSDNPIIEIGSFCGLSTNMISFYMRQNNKSNKLITADKWIFENTDASNAFLEGSKITNAEYKQFVKESFIRNIKFFSKDNLPYTFELFSDELFELWNAGKTATDVLGRQVQLGGTISFAYIDGNHTYEYAKRDFDNVDKHLEPGGFILFDDSADYSSWGVCRVIKEIKEAGNYEVIIKNPNYLVRKIK